MNIIVSSKLGEI